LRRDHLTLRKVPAAARRRSDRRLISGFGKSVTATPLWSQRATLVWPEFEVRELGARSYHLAGYRRDLATITARATWLMTGWLSIL
jgi:hypothetical protein